MTMKKIFPLILLVVHTFLFAQHIPNEIIKKHLSGKLLLIINFNRPHYNNILFLENLYKPYFDTLVFYGPQPDPRIQEYTYEGLYWTSSYATIVEAMKKYPDYDGYFWLNDDCALFTWNLINLDINKLWMSPPGFANIPSLTKGFSDISKDERSPFWQCQIYRTQLTSLYDKLPLHLKKNIKKNYGEYTIPWGPAEGCYIPRRYVPDFVALAQQCLQEKIVVEQALHFIFACLEQKSQQEVLPLLWTEYLIDKECTPRVNSIAQIRQCPLFAQCIRNKLVLFHHMKFSDPKNRQFITHLYQLMTKPLSPPPSGHYKANKKTQKKILLIIHFKNPSYENISFFQQLYNPYFENIIFYGDQQDPWVHHCTQQGTCKGICAATLEKIANNHPDYDGYLWLESDCALCCWKMTSLDPNKIWHSDGGLQACYIPKKDMLTSFEKNSLKSLEETVTLHCKRINNHHDLIAAKSKYDVKRSALFAQTQQENIIILAGIDFTVQKNKNYLTYLFQLERESEH